MITAASHRHHAPSTEDQAIGRFIAVLRRRTGGKPRSELEAPRPSTRAIRSAGAVAEWHAMGRSF